VGEDIRIVFFELQIEADPDHGGDQDDWHGRKEGDQCQFPAKRKGYCNATGNVEEGN
jgi:hypothetical protein